MLLQQNQVRVDQGREWILMLFAQDLLAHLHKNTSRASHFH